MKFYVTTPIYYPNDIPHLGHAYTTIAADVIARWHKLNGDDVFFLTGTDEHGIKLQEAAEKHGKAPKEFIDELIPKFKEYWKKLNINYDRFIRTTDADHKEVVQHIIKKSFENGDIYKGKYSGLYCKGCERFFLERELINGLCPDHKKKPEYMEEETYFFKLSKYQEKLLKYYEENPDFVSPDFRKHEIINRVKEGLEDVSITRTSFKWGIPFPLDDKHITYVWFDALTNYLTGVGYLKNKEMFEKYWPADVHVMAKDIVWFHAVLWPAMLFSAGIAPPKRVFGHGFWVCEGTKMSKTIGNVVSIEKLIEKGTDAARYFVLREVPFGQDGNYTKESFLNRYNGELANGLGNLAMRIVTLVKKYPIDMLKDRESKLKAITEKTLDNTTKYMNNYEFDKALSEIWLLITACDEYINATAPWKLAKENKQIELENVLYDLAETMRIISHLILPFIPESAEKIIDFMGYEREILKNLKWGKDYSPKKAKDEKMMPLFPKIESAN